MANTRTPRGDDERNGTRTPGDDYFFTIARDGGCVLRHTHTAHLTFHRADGSIDPAAQNFRPIPPIDAAAHPPINFRYRGVITDPINPQTPQMSDCVMVAFKDTPHGTQNWNGRIQVICRGVSRGPTNVWLDYNGQQEDAQHVEDLEAGEQAPDRCLFTRRLGFFKQAHQPVGTEYREALHVSVSGCTVTIIGEATVRGADGRMVRTTKIHTINCCHDEGETL